MCWGIPAKVLAINELTAKVDFGDGSIKEVLIAIGDELHIGDFVLVHAGAIISKISLEDLLTSFEYLKEMAIEAAKENGIDPEEVKREFDIKIKRLIKSE
jgi:hydrogenase expression/formation protein HypC